MAIESLTDAEAEALDKGQCPDCGSPDFYLGPRGGMNRNIQCANDQCRSKFNLVLGMAGSFGKQRLSRPLRLNDRVQARRPGRDELTASDPPSPATTG